MLGLLLARKGPWSLLVLPWLALPRRATTARAQVRGTKVPPALVHQQEPPGLGHTRCRALLGRALTVHGHAGPGSRCSLTPHPPRLPQASHANRGVVGGEACEACVTWAACAGLDRAGMRHVAHDSSRKE